MSRLEPRLLGIPVPRIGPESVPYWEGTRLGELRFQRCDACGAANFGPGLVCRKCRSRDLTWTRSAGRGEVFSWTVIWRPQTPAFEVPYAPAIVRLDEGYDLLTALVGLDHAEISDGLRVCVEFHEISPEITLPFFAPDPEHR
ncbi:MAG: hypothetical protein JWL72_1599 [Ilumatobacteraceae bacterium]|nr:hypothetical protein [Ilumatobacteraceae bacterium]MCU1388261.1 hypothetical protein [Ilumatobacteraceae bacterium]